MRKIYFALLISIILSVPVAFNQCSEVSFTPAVDSKASITGNDDGSQTYQATHMFSQNQLRPLDIVWVVDNSGSMSTEAAHVRNNLVNFVSTLANVTDVKLALLSAIGSTGTLVDYPTIPIPNLKINQSVSSTNGLRLLSSTICKVGSTHALCNSGGEAAVRGQLQNFLRADSHKVVVMVTDDESSVPMTDFLDVYSESFDRSTVTVYGWVGLGGNLSPCQARTGTQYSSLATATGGEVYNVCDTDWTSRFNQLANNVVTLVKDTIALPNNVINSTILSVTLNDQPIAPVDYTISPAGIAFNETVRQMYPGPVILRINFR